jgi:hypothetical protein
MSPDLTLKYSAAGLGPTSEMGQTRKYSPRVDVVSFTPRSGHRRAKAPRPKSARSGPATLLVAHDGAFWSASYRRFLPSLVTLPACLARSTSFAPLLFRVLFGMGGLEGDAMGQSSNRRWRAASSRSARKCASRPASSALICLPSRMLTVSA